MKRSKPNDVQQEFQSLVDQTFLEISTRQLDVIRLLAAGNSTKDIASLLGISETTVKAYQLKVMSNMQRETVEQIVRRNMGHALPPGQPLIPMARPPINAEYVLCLLLRKEEREVVVGDLIESYNEVLKRFDKRRADIWFYKQVTGSLFPLFRRAMLRIGGLVWLGRVLRRLIS